MRTLEDLNKLIYPLPSLFAAQYSEADDDQNISPIDGREGEMDFDGGFSEKYSQNPPDGEYLQRNDFNRFGEFSTRESHFKQSGGVHTFAQQVSEDASGYPEGSVLTAYDGLYLSLVESTEAANTKAFYDETNNRIVPYVIDCPVKKDVSDPLPARVLWRTVNYVYGIGTGLFSLKLDYTRATPLKPGDKITVDSFVVGDKIAYIRYDVSSLIDQPIYPLTHTTTIANNENRLSLENITNKGKCGFVFDYLPGFNWPCVQKQGGCGIYQLSFFAKAGSVFSGEVSMYNGKKNILANVDPQKRAIEWTAIPIIPVVDSTTEEV